MIINRIIDNASVAIASANRRSVASARAQALAHPRDGGANVFGLSNNRRFHAEWAAWANGTAVRELDYHDTFLAADYSHPETIFLRCWLWPNRQVKTGRILCARPGDRLRNTNQLGESHLSTCAQNRSYRTSRALRSGRHWHVARAEYRDRVSIGSTSSAYHGLYTAVPQG